MSGPARPPLSLKGRALRLLAAREHSRTELERKLHGDEISPEELTRLLDELQALGYLNEQRVAESLLYRRAPRLGLTRLKQELQHKGLDADTVQAALEPLRASELERAREVWRKKFGQPPQDSAERARQMRFLAGRGFGGAVIRQVVSGTDPEDASWDDAGHRAD